MSVERRGNRVYVGVVFVFLAAALAVWKMNSADTAQPNAPESLDQLECDPGQMLSFTHGEGPGETFDSPTDAANSYAQKMYPPTTPGRTMAQTYSGTGRAQYVLKYVTKKQAFLDVAKGPDGKWSVTASSECSNVAP